MDIYCETKGFIFYKNIKYFILYYHYENNIYNIDFLTVKS